MLLAFFRNSLAATPTKRFLNRECPSIGSGTPLVHTFSAFWLRSSVVSVLISMTTDMLLNSSNTCHLIFLAGLQIEELAPSCSAVASIFYLSCALLTQYMNNGDYTPATHNKFCTAT